MGARRAQSRGPGSISVGEAAAPRRVWGGGAHHLRAGGKNGVELGDPDQRAVPGEWEAQGRAEGSGEDAEPCGPSTDGARLAAGSAVTATRGERPRDLAGLRGLVAAPGKSAAACAEQRSSLLPSTHQKSRLF